MRNKKSEWIAAARGVIVFAALMFCFSATAKSATDRDWRRMTGAWGETASARAMEKIGGGEGLTERRLAEWKKMRFMDAWMRDRQTEMLSLALDIIDDERMSGEALFYLDVLWSIASTPEDLRVIASRLESLIARGDASPEVTATAWRVLASVKAVSGDDEIGGKSAKAIGAIRDWRIIGPFSNDGNTCLDTENPPETSNDVEGSYPGKVHSVRWRAAAETSTNGWLHFGQLIEPVNDSCAYAAAEIESDGDEAALAAASFPDSLKVWLNGELVFRRKALRPASIYVDQEIFPLKLRKGKNHLLVKSTNRTGDWRLMVRIARGGNVENLFERLRRTVGSNIYRQIALGYLWRYQRDESTMEDVKYLRRMIARRPFNPILYYLLSQSEQKFNGRMRAYADALRWDPMCVPCLLQEGTAFSQSLRLNEKAKEDFEAALRIEPESMSGLYALGSYFVEVRSDNLEARKILNKMESVSPNHMAVHTLRKRLRESDEFGLPGTNRELADEYAAVYRANRSRSGFLDAAVNALALLNERGEALWLLEEDTKLFPWKNDAYEKRAKLLMGGNDLDGAIKTLEEGIRKFPDHAAFEDMLGDAYAYKGDDVRAAAAWEKSLELEPSQPAVRRKAEFHGEKADAFFAPFKPDVDALVRKNRGNKKSDSSVKTLFRQSVVEIHADGTYKRIDSHVVQLFDEQAIERERTWGFSYDPANERMRLRKAAAYTPDGRTIEGTYSESDAAPSVDVVYYRNRNARIQFQSLTPGTILYVEYEKSVTNGNIFGDYYGERFMMGDMASVDFSRVAITSPTARNIYFNARNFKAKPKVVENAALGTTTRIFTIAGIKRRAEEPYMPPMYEITPALEVSTYDSWDALAKWYWGLIRDRFDTNDELKKKVAELTVGAATTEEKIRKIYDFVVSDIRYLGIEFGIGGFQPHRATFVLNAAYGDCKDKATLLVTMLREIGVKAELVIIGTTNAFGDRELTFPSLLANHAIARIHMPDGTLLFADGTAQYHGLDELPDADQNAAVLVMDEDRPTIARIPVIPADKTVSSLVADMAIDADGNVAGSATETLTGGFAPDRRSDLQLENKRKTTIERRLSGYDLGAPDVRRVATQNIEDIERPVVVSYEFRSEGLMSFKEKTASMSPFFMRKNLSSSYGAGLVTRKFDIFGLTPSTISRDVRIRIPDGVEIVSYPQSDSLDTAAFSYRVITKKTGSELRIVADYKIKKRRVSASEYGAFRGALVRFENLLDEKLILRKKP